MLNSRLVLALVVGGGMSVGCGSVTDTTSSQTDPNIALGNVNVIINEAQIWVDGTSSNALVAEFQNTGEAGNFKLQAYGLPDGPSAGPTTADGLVLLAESDVMTVGAGWSDTARFEIPYPNSVDFATQTSPVAKIVIMSEQSDTIDFFPTFSSNDIVGIGKTIPSAADQNSAQAVIQNLVADVQQNNVAGIQALFTTPLYVELLGYDGGESITANLSDLPTVFGTLCPADCVSQGGLTGWSLSGTYYRLADGRIEYLAYAVTTLRIVLIEDSQGVWHIDRYEHRRPYGFSDAFP